MLALKLAWRSFIRHRRRSAITTIAISLGFAMLISVTGIAINGHDRMANLGVRLGSGHVVVQGKGFQQEQTLNFLVDDPERVEAVARTIPDVQNVAQRVYTGGLISSGELNSATMIAGVVPDIEPQVSDIASPSHRTSGGYLRPRSQLEFNNAPGDIYLGDTLARTLDVEVEDRVVLTASPANAERPASAAFRVRGIFHTGVSELDGFYVQIALGDAQEMLGLDGKVTQVALLLNDLRATARVTKEMRAALDDQDDLEVLPWQVALSELYDAIVLDSIGNYLLHTIVFLIVAIGIFNTILMSVLERTREFGVMIAIGTSRQQLFAQVIAEAVVLAVVAYSVGLAIGLSLHYWMSTTGLDVGALYGDGLEFAGISFNGRIYSTLYPAQVAQWTAIVFGLVILSSLYPAFRATRLKPVEAMRHA